jgi:hypothetical protein
MGNRSASTIFLGATIILAAATAAWAQENGGSGGTFGPANTGAAPGSQGVGNPPGNNDESGGAVKGPGKVAPQSPKAEDPSPATTQSSSGSGH